MTSTLSIVILAVADVARAQRFYTTVFDWTVRVDAGVFTQLSLPDGPDVALYARAGFGTNTGRPPVASPPGHTSAAELYVTVTGDLSAWVDRAVAAGATLLSPPADRPWGERVAYLADPDAHVLALSSGPV